MVTGRTAELVEATLTLSFNRGELTPYCVLRLEREGYSRELNATDRVPPGVLNAAQNFLEMLATQEGATLASQPPEGV
jgi:hypothetical protein